MCQMHEQILHKIDRLSNYCIFARIVWGLPYMMSALGGGRGSPKSRLKEQGCVNSVQDKGGGVQKSENCADVL